MNTTASPDVACLPYAIPAAERRAHFALGRDLMERQARERAVLPDGYAIRFAADAFEAVARFVANERKCCPFMSFEIALSSESGPLWLRITGPEGTRRVLDTELNLAMPCSCDADSLIKWTTAGGLLAALGVCAACCLLPFALLSVGVAGAWATTLAGFAPYKWVFIGITATLLGYGFYAAYLRPKRTSFSGAAREACDSGRGVRVGLWIATLLAISGIVFERLEPILTAALR